MEMYGVMRHCAKYAIFACLVLAGMSARAQIQEEERCEGFICDMSEVEQTW